MNKNIPNIISLLRIALIPVLFVLFFLDLFIAAAVFFVLLSLTDSLDGFLARKYGVVSDIGKFLDPIADKVLVVSAMFLVAIGGVLDVYSAAVCFTLVVARDFIISGFRLIAVEAGVVIAADIWGKLKTFLLDIALALLLAASLHKIVLYVGMGVLYAATLTAVFSGINYIVKNKKVFGKKDEE